MSNQNTLAEQEQAKMDEFFNPTTEQRQAKMAAMMARMKEPEYQREVDIAEAAVNRLAKSKGDLAEWKSSDDKNIPSEKILRKNQIAKAKRKKKAAKDSLKCLRGDTLEQTPAPAVTTVPANTPAVLPMADGATKPAEPAPATWCLRPLQRAYGYRGPLRDALQTAIDAGLPCPTAIQVHQQWMKFKPTKIVTVTATGFEFVVESELKSKKVTLRNLQRAIDGMILQIESK